VSDVDAEGWSYRTDFTGFATAATDTTVVTTVAQRRGSVDGTIENVSRGSIADSGTTSGGSAQKGIMHIARRRKLVRLQYFDGEAFRQSIPFMLSTDSFYIFSYSKHYFTGSNQS
jgi:hypothetical protein